MSVAAVLEEALQLVEALEGLEEAENLEEAEEARKAEEQPGPSNKPLYFPIPGRKNKVRMKVASALKVSILGELDAKIFIGFHCRGCILIPLRRCLFS